MGLSSLPPRRVQWRSVVVSGKIKHNHGVNINFDSNRNNTNDV